jgi:hypothetical protein
MVVQITCTLKLYLIVFQDKVLGLTVKTESPQDYALVTFAAFSVYVELSSTGYKQCFPCNLLVWTHKAWFRHSTWCYSRIWRQSLLHLLFYLCRCNTILKVLYCRHSAEGATPLRYLPPVDYLRSVELLIRVVASLFDRPVNRIYTHFSCVKYLCIRVSNRRTLLSFTRPYNV